MELFELAKTLVDGGDFDPVLVELELVVGHQVVSYEGLADFAFDYL